MHRPHCCVLAFDEKYSQEKKFINYARQPDLWFPESSSTLDEARSIVGNLHPGPWRGSVLFQKNWIQNNSFRLYVALGLYSWFVMLAVSLCCIFELYRIQRNCAFVLGASDQSQPRWRPTPPISPVIHHKQTNTMVKLLLYTESQLQIHAPDSDLKH